MIHPSYVDLMKVVNKDIEEGEEPVISSRYSIVMATAKRARQIIAGDEPMIRVRDKEKPLSVAVDEMNEDKLHILTAEEAQRLAMEAESKDDGENAADEEAAAEISGEGITAEGEQESSGE